MTNHIDKYLLTNFFQDRGVGILLLFSALLSSLALPFLCAIDPRVLDVDRGSIGALAVVAGLNLIVLWSYFTALREDEASVVIVFYQMVPVVAAVMSYIFLDEHLIVNQLIAMAIVLVGTAISSLDFEHENGIRFRRRTVFFMSIAVLAWASEATLFKRVALEENVWRSAFWEHVSLVLFGAAFACVAPRARRTFFSVWKMNSGRILALNGLNELLYMIGSITVSYASLLAPMALILLSQTFQPVFVFLLGTAMTFLFPRFHMEKLSRRAVVQKMVAIFLTGLGAYWLISATP